MQPHRLVGQGLHHPQLHHSVRQQSQFPVLMALGGRAAGQGYQVRLGPLVQLPVPVGLDSILKRPLQPVLGKAPLDAEHRSLGHVQGLGHPGSRPALAGLERIRARLITLAEPFPVRTICSSWSRSSGVSRTANLSLTTPHLTTTSSLAQNIIDSQASESIYQIKFDQVLVSCIRSSPHNSEAFQKDRETGLLVAARRRIDVDSPFIPGELRIHHTSIADRRDIFNWPCALSTFGNEIRGCGSRFQSPFSRGVSSEIASAYTLTSQKTSWKAILPFAQCPLRNAPRSVSSY